MTWVAFDRGIKSAERYELEAPLARWRELRERIHRQICSQGYDAKRNCFVQSYGSEQLDASLLMMATLGFLRPNDERFVGTVRAIEMHLLCDGLVLRYNT